MKRALLVLAAATLAGCVSSGRHEALQKSFDEQQASLKQRERELAETRASLDAEQRKAKELGERISALDADIAKANADKSAMLKDASRLKASIAEMEQALADLAKRKAEADARLAEFRSLLDRFKSLIDAGKLKVKIVDGRMVVALASDVLFASGSATLSKDGKAAVSEVATVLSEIPNRKFMIEGHTDNVPMKSAVYPSNWELAAARALTVTKTMIEGGMPPDRISAASFGEYKPAQSNETPEGKDANRRIEIVVVPDLSSLPGFDELNRVAK